MKNTQDINAEAVRSSDWLARIRELTDAIELLATERAQLEQKVLESKSPFAVGDIIEWNKGTRHGRVVKIVPWCCGDPMWKVARIKKDGSEGEIVEVRPYQDVRRAN